jgi:hypothetical protein
MLIQVVDKRGRFCAFGPVEAWLKSASEERDLENGAS